MNHENKDSTPELLSKLDAWCARRTTSRSDRFISTTITLKQPLKLAHIKPRLLGHEPLRAQPQLRERDRGWKTICSATYRRTNHKNLHVRGYKEQGTTSTPFDMVVMNDLDRFHLVADVIDRVSALGPRAAYPSKPSLNACWKRKTNLPLRSGWVLSLKLAVQKSWLKLFAIGFPTNW